MTATTPPDSSEESGANPVRAGMGELTLQADLAAMNVRDELRKELEAAENAWLAAKNRLQLALGDADAALDGMRHATRKVLSDLASARDAAEAAAKRARGGA